MAIRVELWRERPGWFDQHLTTEGIEMKVVRDPWGGSFTVLRADSVQASDSTATLQENLSRHRIRIAVDHDWCDETSRYRIVATTYVRPLTASDVGEVEAWLKGELRGFGKGVLGLPRGLFGIVRDLSGLGERSSKADSPAFQLAARPGGLVRVLFPGTAEGAYSSTRI